MASPSLKDAPTDDVRAEGSGLLQQILPAMLRFMEDEYDDTCSTIFPMLQTVLASVGFNPIIDHRLLTCR